MSYPRPMGRYNSWDSSPSGGESEHHTYIHLGHNNGRARERDSDEDEEGGGTPAT